MGIFGGFRATFSKDSSQKKQKKSEVGVVVCTSYRVFSEFSDDQYTVSSFRSTASTSVIINQNGLKSRAPIIKTPSSSSTLQDNSQFERVTIKTAASKTPARQIKAKSQYDLSTLESENLRNDRVKSTENLSISNQNASSRPSVESKPTPKARKSVENVVQDKKADNKSAAYIQKMSQNNAALHSKANEEYEYIQPSDVREVHPEGIYDEPVYDDTQTVEVTALQKNEGVVLQSKTKKVKKEKGKKRETEKVVLRTAKFEDKNQFGMSTFGMPKREQDTLSSNNQTSTNFESQSVEVCSQTSIKSGTQTKHDYGSYFDQKATSLGYSTSEAASIFFQDDEEDGSLEVIEINNKQESNGNSWRGVNNVMEITDDDETRRISSVEC